MTPPLHLLIVEDSENDTLLIIRELRRGGYDPVVHRVDTAEGMSIALDEKSWDVVIADYNLPQFSAPAALQIMQSKGFDYPFIIVSGSIGEDSAVAAMKAGAHDYVMKHSLARLVPAVEREIREAQERKRRLHAEQALRDNEERFRSLIENALDIITVLDRYGRIQYSSPAIARVLGYHPQDLKHQRVLKYLHPSEVRLAATAFQKVLHNPKEVTTLELQFRCQDGSWRTLEAVSKQYLDLGGELSLVVNARDITERKQAEEVRKQLAKEKELNELKTQFVSMVSHEFRTPLSVIAMSAQLLKHFDSLTSLPKKQEYLGRIETATQRMVQLLDEVLFLGKREADRLEFNPTFLELVAFCQTLVEEMQWVNGNQRQIKFHSSQSCLSARMDEALLRHILSNLLSNAIKYSPDTEEIQFELVWDEDQVIFRVTDQGIGIPLADQKQLFESFHRGSNVKKIPGTGLGLAIVKQSVELHGGTIQVNSQENRGTTFIVTLPLLVQSSDNVLSSDKIVP